MGSVTTRLKAVIASAFPDSRLIKLLGVGSYVRFRRHFGRLDARRSAIESTRVRLKIRPLRQTVTVRSGTTDAEVLVDTFLGRHHLPPSDLQPEVIWDLGANIGLTALHYADLYPNVQIMAIELDADNAEIARINTARYADRIDLVMAAVWSIDGQVAYTRVPGLDWGLRVTDVGQLTVTAISLNTLLARTGVPDYVKMDIEGAEASVLKEHTEWSSSVRCISVEPHPMYDYSTDACARDLRALGFIVEIDAHQPNEPRVIGTR